MKHSKLVEQRGSFDLLNLNCPVFRVNGKHQNLPTDKGYTSSMILHLKFWVQLI